MYIQALKNWEDCDMTLKKLSVLGRHKLKAGDESQNVFPRTFNCTTNVMVKIVSCGSNAVKSENLFFFHILEVHKTKKK